MLCPYCGEKTTVAKTDKDDNHVYRYRKCLANKYHRFKTIETMICEKEEKEGKEDGNGKRG